MWGFETGKGEKMLAGGAARGNSKEVLDLEVQSLQPPLLRGIQHVTAWQRQDYESAAWRAREWKGPERTLIFLEEKVSKNDLNGKIFSLSVSWTNIALHVMQRQCSSMLGMSNLGGKLLPLVLTLVFWLLFPLFPLSSPLQPVPDGCHKVTSE